MAYNDTFNFLKDHAGKAMREATNSENRIAGMGKPNLREPNFTHTVNAPTVDKPPQFSDLFDGADSADPTYRWLDAKVEEWISDYFPAITACLKTLPDEWLCDVISGVAPLGHSAHHFAAVWNQSRDRVQRTMTSSLALTRSEFSARGFSLPSGAMVDAMDRVRREGVDAVQETNRAETIKDAEIKLELLKFAEEQALRYKLGIMTAMADFYKAWLVIPDKDIERARIRAQAMGSFYSALSSYYGVEVAFENLRLKAKELDAEVDLSVDRNRLTGYTSANSANAALGQAVQGFASISAAAANAASSLTAKIEAI